MNLQSHVPLRKWVSLNLPAHVLLINTKNPGNTYPHLIGGRIKLLNRNSVTSAIQDSPLSFVSLSFGFHPIFVKYLQSTTKLNSDQMCAYTTCDTATPPDRRERAATRIGTRPVIFFMPRPCNTGGQRAAFHVLMGSPGPTEVVCAIPPEEEWGEFGPSDSKTSVFSTVLCYCPVGSREVLSPEDCYKSLIPREQALANFFCKGPDSQYFRLFEPYGLMTNLPIKCFCHCNTKAHTDNIKWMSMAVFQ